MDSPSGAEPIPSLSSAALRPLRALIVEDSAIDVLLLLRELKRHGYEVTHGKVSTAQELREALHSESWDVVLSDFSMPDFNGLEALELVKASGRDVPFILVSGTIGEDIAVDAMKAGAHDYLLKDHLARLGGAVERELRDVAERRALRQTEELLRLRNSALDACANAIVITDRAGQIKWVNPAFSQLTGYPRVEALGHTLRELQWSGHHDEAFFKGLWGTILAGRVWRGEIVNRRKDGSLYTEEQTITPVLDARGEVAHFIAIKEDVTRRKLLEAQVLRAQRLDGIGALASGIAHDLNNVLAPMLMIAPILRAKAKDSESRSMIDTLESCAFRGAGIIKQLLTFARGTPGTQVPLQVHHLLRDVIKIVRETFPRELTPRLEAAADLWPIRGDAIQLHQAFVNLCLNARDAMPEGGTLTIEARCLELSEEAAGAIVGAKPGPYVVVSVTDTGTGIRAEHLDHIFDPFFTTKEIGKGTGLGLAAVQGIVRRHGGFLQVRSQVGQGSTFELFFPAVPNAPAVVPATAPGPVPRGNGELVLLVDDEAAVREALRRSLESHGYRVLQAADGADGLGVFARHRTEVRVVLTDLRMPVMNGAEMIAALWQLAPGLPVVGMTGMADRATHGGLEQLDLPILLSKPFPVEEVLNALHQVLARAAGA